MPQVALMVRACDYDRAPGSVLRRATAFGLTLAGVQVLVIAAILLSCVLYGIAYIGGWYDDNCYHIPLAVEIVHHLNPYWVTASPVEAHWFPAAAETFVAVLIGLTHSLALSNLSGSLCFGALVILTYAFAGIWCRDIGPRLASVACVAATPLMTGQSLAFYVDIHMALVICAAVYLNCLAVVRGRARYGYYGLAVAMIAAGIKYTGLQFLICLIPVCVWCIWQAPAPRRPSKAALAAMSIAALFVSGWYVRNWVYRGNPIYPFTPPAWTQPLLSFAGTNVEVDPQLENITARTVFPHPWVPDSWLLYRYTPDMTADGFGSLMLVSLGCVVLSVVLIRRLSSPQRRAWILTLITGSALLATFPYGARVPRYVLFVPVLGSLALSVVAGVAWRKIERYAITSLCAAILCFTGAYAYANIVGSGAGREAYSHLQPYNPVGITRYPYAAKGHLRIGYTSGFGNFIALLYDWRLTNELVPLHYKNYAYNQWKEFDSPAQFAAFVKSLDLDYIHIFDPHYPGVEILQDHFPDKIAKQ